MIKTPSKNIAKVMKRLHQNMYYDNYYLTDIVSEAIYTDAEILECAALDKKQFDALFAQALSHIIPKNFDCARKCVADMARAVVAQQRYEKEQEERRKLQAIKDKEAKALANKLIADKKKLLASMTKEQKALFKEIIK